jgi:DNA-binding IclR family transcriptional regulator
MPLEAPADSFQVSPPAALDKANISDLNSVLAKVHRILLAFGPGDDSLSLSELARRTGVPKASVYRLAQELVDLSFLERVGNGYCLGASLFNLGNRVQRFKQLRVISEPYLFDLFLMTRETVHLAVRHGLHVMYVDKVAGTARNQRYSYASGHLPLHSTATGKALVAFAPDPEMLISAMTAEGLTRVTPRTVCALGRLRRQIADARDNGYATEVEETALGWMSVAVPVVGHNRVAQVALSVTVPTARRDLLRYLPDLHSTAGLIAAALDGTT